MRFRYLLSSGLAALCLSVFAQTARAQAVTTVDGTPVSSTSISWVWNIAGGAAEYRITDGNNALELPNSPVAINALTQHSLLGNTSHSIWVEPAFPPGPYGALRHGPTVYTLATPPVAAATPIDSVSRAGFVGRWTLGGGSNGLGTRYHMRVTRTSDSEVDDDTTDDTLFYDFNNGDPNTEYRMEVAAANFDEVMGGYVLLGTTITLAETPSNAQITAIQSGSLDVSWASNGNPSYTPYEVKYALDGNFASAVTFIPFSSGFTGTSTRITGLLTGRSYTIHITARNINHFLSSPAQLIGSTSNGGGPVGNIQQSLPATLAADINGSIGGDRLVSLRILSGTFDSAVTLLISTNAAIAQCGGVDASLAITVSPPIQPKQPVAVSYSVPAVNIPVLTNATLVRYDPVSNSCVPLRSAISVSGGVATITALTSHFSVFGVQNVAPSGGLATARIFPNPFFVRRQGLLTLDKLMANTRVRIYTLRGEEVFDETSGTNGVLVWNGNNKNNLQVSSGIYVITLDAAGTHDVRKVVVIR